MKRQFFVMCLVALPPVLHAQQKDCRTERDLPAFVDCRVKQLASGIPRDYKINDFANQSEPLSLVENSTSLVDSTAASDIASVSTTLSAFSSKSRTPNSTDVNSTFSAYAIYAMLRQKSPFDPALFTRESNLRALSFTYADSFPSDKGATADQGSRTYGAKYLIHAGRDLASPMNAGKRNSIINALENQLGPASGAFIQIEDFLFQRLGPTPKTPAARTEYLSTLGNEAAFHAAVAALNEEDFRRIDSILQNAALTQLRVTNASIDAARQIVHASQFSASFSAKISKGDDKNTYRSEFIHDKQFTDWLKETLNVGWDFQNAQKATAKNRQIGRVALQGETALNGYNGKPRIPLSLTYGGEGDWGSNGTPIYKAQLKLKITVFPGIDVPLVGSYANRAGNVPRADLKGQVNISLDFAKILKGAKKPS